MFGIGEFSRVTSIPVKTLRFYHERGILAPSAVDPQTGYRFYDGAKVERARVIRALRRLEFSLDQIAQVLSSCEEDIDLLTQLRERREQVQANLNHQQEIADALDAMIRQANQERAEMTHSNLDVVEKTIPPVTVAGIRMKGRYSDCGKAFGKLGRQAGRFISGKAMTLFYDGEYREADADFEPCFPVRKPIEREGITYHELPEARCLTLTHHGPYEELGRSYEKLLAYAKQHGYRLLTPSREVYLKGPGMIFRGNPQKYATEIQAPFEEGADGP